MLLKKKLNGTHLQKTIPNFNVLYIVAYIHSVFLSHVFKLGSWVKIKGDENSYNIIIFWLKCFFSWVSAAQKG